VRPSSHLHGESKGRIGKRIRDQVERGGQYRFQFVSFINNGTPLASFADDFDRCVDFALKSFQGGVRVEVDDSLKVEKEVSFTSPFESFVVAELLKRLSGITKRSEVSLNHLESMTSIYQSRPMIYTIVRNEIHRLKRVIDSDRQSTDWTPLSQVLKITKSPTRGPSSLTPGCPVV
jgi:hypothetical protein